MDLTRSKLPAGHMRRGGFCKKARARPGTSSGMHLSDLLENVCSDGPVSSTGFTVMYVKCSWLLVIFADGRLF
jgi:hypothetical protein